VGSPSFGSIWLRRNSSNPRKSNKPQKALSQAFDVNSKGKVYQLRQRPRDQAIQLFYPKQGTGATSSAPSQEAKLSLSHIEKLIELKTELDWIDGIGLPRASSQVQEDLDSKSKKLTSEFEMIREGVWLLFPVTTPTPKKQRIQPHQVTASRNLEGFPRKHSNFLKKNHQVGERYSAPLRTYWLRMKISALR